MSFFATCVYLRKNLPAVCPPTASLYASSTCVHLRLLAGPFGQGLRQTLSETLLTHYFLYFKAEKYKDQENVSAYFLIVQSF